MSKFITMDLEIYDDLPPEGGQYTNQGISCAAMAWRQSDGVHTRKVHDLHGGRFEPAMALHLLYVLKDAVEHGYSIVTWNGLSFDFRVLGIESGDVHLAKELALQHIDPCFEAFCKNGYPVGLNAVSLGLGFKGKVHEVVLKSGEKLMKMEGSQAPALWRAGEIPAVLEYLKGDVVSLLEVVEAIEKQGQIRWTSKSGRPMKLEMDLLTVEDCLQLPVPDTSWMKDPWTRDKFAGWLNLPAIETDELEDSDEIRQNEEDRSGQ